MGQRILVIEDDRPSLDLIVYLLGAFGYTTLQASDGEEGLAVARREHPDLIICDIQLPKLDGTQVVRELKGDADTRGIPVVAVTAYAMVGDRDRLLSNGFDGYIPKPITPEAFVGQIEGYLRSEPA